MVRVQPGLVGHASGVNHKGKSGGQPVARDHNKRSPGAKRIERPRKRAESRAEIHVYALLAHGGLKRADALPKVYVEGIR
jgi:hypothetical protein